MASKLAIDPRYRMGPEIGRGSFGIVYKAEDVTTGDTLAIKVLLPWAKDDSALRHRLKREAKLTQMLKSEHAVKIHHFDETDDGDLYIVMEFLDGQDLTRVLTEEAPLEPERVANIAVQVLDALGESHRLGVVHRDLKPHNILLCRKDGLSDLVKVLDFGIAKVAGTSDGSGLMETTKLTVQGGVLGTPVYMSPEQCRGEDLTPCSDLYSLGIVLYEMLTGRVPFDNENPVQVMIMQNNNPLPPLPDSVAKTLIGQVTQRALEKHPEDRFASAEEMAAAIQGKASVSAGPAPTQASGTQPSRLSSPAANPTAAKPASYDGPPSESAGGSLGLVLIGLVVVAAAVAVWMVVSRFL